jgi:hypothetical protein
MKYTAKHFGYKNDDMLMNPHTGTVDLAQYWALEADEWDTEENTVEEQFATLVHVEKKNGEWVEV